MDAGKLRDRVTLQSKVVTRDELEGTVETWHDEATVWAEVSIVGGREFNAASQTREPTTMKVRIRRGPPVTNLWRVIWRTVEGDIQVTRILNVQVVSPVLPERDGWDLLCSEGLNEG